MRISARQKLLLQSDCARIVSLERTMREAIDRLLHSSHSTEQPEPYESRAPIIRAFLQAALQARERAVYRKVIEYVRMRMSEADTVRQGEVLAGNIAKEAIENGAIAELIVIETWVNQHAQEVGQPPDDQAKEEG